MRRIPGSHRAPAAVWFVLVIGLLAATACSAPVLESPFGQGASETPTPHLEIPTLPPAPIELVVCVAEEPDTFAPFVTRNASAEALLPLLYDGPIDVLGYQFSPVLLERIPSVEAGDVRFEPVRVLSGDLYFNPDSGLPEELRPGKSYLPSGCTSVDCRRKYEGGGAELDRMVVDFHLLPGLVWSDGEPLTAEDSEFAYRLDSDPALPSLKDQVNRTSSYEALDPAIVRWTGIPGFIDPEFGGNFWSPLPQHLLGEIPTEELMQSEVAGRTPVGWGPYRLASWDAGEGMTFVPNPNFTRWAGGVPGFEQIRIRFLDERGDGAIQQLLTGECDVLEESLTGSDSINTVAALAGQGRLQWLTTAGPIIERLDFNTSPVDGRPAFFTEAEVRRAIAECIDRPAAIAETIGGLSPVPEGFLPADHPLGLPDPTVTTSDPVAAAERLQASGWVDEDGDPSTPRRAQGVGGVSGGTPFQVSLLTLDDSLHLALAEKIVQDLGTCGIEVSVEGLPANRLYQVWPDGPVFGRSFDLVLWPWMNWISPACEVFSTGEIPSANNPQGSNASGFSEAAYDGACREASLGPASGEAYRASLETTEAILIEALPALPILQWPRILAFGPEVCGVRLDPTAVSAFWDIESWAMGEACGE